MNSRVAVRPSDDPFKKYWWVILVGFGVTGAWVSLPMMESSVGSTHIDTSGAATGIPSGEGSLDAATNPSGAAGSALDLSMDIKDRSKKGGDGMMSSLYQAPEEEPAGPTEAPTAGAAASGGSLASALAKAATAADPTGWGGQKAQKGFTQPKLAGGAAMGGVGGSGGGSSASSGGGFGAFGSQNSSVGSVGTRGLSGKVGDLPEAKTAKGALTNAASKATQSANLRSKDGQVSGLSSIFDGRSQRGGARIGGDGGEAIGAGGIYGSLDASPSNLKLNDPNLDKKEFKEVPSNVANTKDNSSEEFKKQIAMMIVTTVVGGVVGGAVGGAITSMGSQLAQMWQTQQRSESQLNKSGTTPPR